LLTSGIRSYRGLHACWPSWSMGPIFDCRETEVRLCPRPCSVCEHVGERWSDEAGWLLIRSYRGLHACWRLVDGTDFRLSRNGDYADAVAAHSLRECRGATVRRRRLNAYLGFAVTPRLACMLARDVEVGPIFDYRETVMGLSPWRRTVCESVGERRCDGAG
jgi:hypothetical protein